jgi:hypothetical protein
MTPKKRIPGKERYSSNVDMSRVSWLSQLPVIAELAQPLPRIEIAEGTYIVKDLLRQIVLQAPSTTGRPTTK